MTIAFVSADAEHLTALQAFVLDHGANAWNWLPEAGIAEHVRDIAAGQAQGLLAMDGLALVGAVTFCSTRSFAQYQSTERRDAAHGYICEAVVRRDQVGRGLGARLLLAAGCCGRPARPRSARNLHRPPRRKRRFGRDDAQGRLCGDSHLCRARAQAAWLGAHHRVPCLVQAGLNRSTRSVINASVPSAISRWASATSFTV